MNPIPYAELLALGRAGRFDIIDAAEVAHRCENDLDFVCGIVTGGRLSHYVWCGPDVTFDHDEDSIEDLFAGTDLSMLRVETIGGERLTADQAEHLIDEGMDSILDRDKAHTELDGYEIEKREANAARLRDTIKAVPA